jgi:signal peptidase I
MSQTTAGGQTDGSGSRASNSSGSRLLSWSTTTALAVATTFAALMLVPALFGLQRYVITGDSMSGTFDRGSIVLSEVVAVDQLRVGDVITFRPPGAFGHDGLVTHRIVAVDDDGRRRPVLRTKGDANASRDPWRVQLSAPEQARVVADVPYVGYAFAVLGIRELRMALIGIPALLVAVALVAGLWRDAGREVQATREAGW